MPLTAKGTEIREALVKEYGEKKGEQVLYAGKNKGTFTGIDACMDKLAAADAAVSEMCKMADWLGQRMDALNSRKGPFTSFPGRDEIQNKTYATAAFISSKVGTTNWVKAERETAALREKYGRIIKQREWDDIQKAWANQ